MHRLPFIRRGRLIPRPRWPQEGENTAHEPEDGGVGPSDADAVPSVPMYLKVASWPQPDAQLGCPLLNGRIPSEIRDIIFKLALTETTVPSPEWQHDFHVRVDHEPAGDEPEAPQVSDAPGPGEAWQMVESQEAGRDWLRPGYTGRKRIYCDLLRTCRLVYLETAYLPALMKEHVFFCADGRHPPWIRNAADPDTYIQESVPSHAARMITELHLHTQMYWLDGLAVRCENSWKRKMRCLSSPSLEYPLRHVRVFDNLQKLHLTFRRGDWWWNETNEPLAINPFEGNETANSTAMHQVMDRVMRDGMPQPDVPPNSWPRAFWYMPSLRMLEVDFETSEHKRDEMVEIVEWAKTWKFPVYRDRGDGQPQDAKGKESRMKVAPRMSFEDEVASGLLEREWLTTEGHPITLMSWRGLPYHWTPECPQCELTFTTNPTCRYCLKRQALLAEGKGPRLYVWTLTWTTKKEETGGEEEESRYRKPVPRQARDMVWSLKSDDPLLAELEVARGDGSPVTLEELEQKVKASGDLKVYL